MLFSKDDAIIYGFEQYEEIDERQFECLQYTLRYLYCQCAI